MLGPIEELETREMMRLWQEAKERKWQMREEVVGRDHRLVKSFDEKDQHRRELWLREADSRDVIMLRQMYPMVTDTPRGPNELSTSRSNDQIILRIHLLDVVFDMQYWLYLTY